MSEAGAVSRSLEQEVLNEVRRQGIVVWLDKDESYSLFVDRLVARYARGEFPFPVVAFRGSFLELLFELEPYGNALDKQQLLIHMPGINEETIRRTPVLELYAPGVRYRKALDTLIREAATARVSPAEVEKFVAKTPTLEEADTWLSSAVSQSTFGLAATLDEFGPKLLAEALGQVNSSLSLRVTAPEEVQVLRGFLHKLTGMDDSWVEAVGKERNPYRTGEIVRSVAVAMTKAELAKIPSDYKGTRMSECGTHRLRYALVGRGKPGYGGDYGIVYLTDSKQHPRPVAKPDAEPELPLPPPPTRVGRRAEPSERDRSFANLREQLKAGVTVVSAPQLFPTPADLACRMVAMAELRQGDRVLEPSAGTGNILRAVLDAKEEAGINLDTVVAVEINPRLCEALDAAGLADVVDRGDFLTTTALDFHGAFHRIIMNPPFVRGADIKHVEHAFDLLASGGRLVAVVCDGPRQRERLRPWVLGRGGTWEPLPADTFKDQGTSVRTALLVVEARS